MSYADDVLFKDLLRSLGIADVTFYPNARVRKIVDIKVLNPYDNHSIGVERWAVHHEDDTVVLYRINFIPDRKGGTIFDIQREAFYEKGPDGLFVVKEKFKVR